MNFKSKLILAAMIFCMGSSIQAQSALECLADKTIEFTEQDPNNFYGEPTVSVPQPYELTYDIVEIQNDCNNNVIKQIVTTWTLTYGSSEETCDHIVGVKKDEFSNYIAPADTTIYTANPTPNMDPSISGYYGPATAQSENVVSNYSDLPIDVSIGFKIVRTWTLLDWCTGETLEHVQLIKVYLDNSSSSEVVTMDFRPISNYNTEFYVDGQRVDLGSCASETTIADQLNCLHQANPGQSIELKISKENDSPLNGVSTLDIVLTMRHILGLEPFNSNWKILAADVNGDQNVSAIDIVEMRKTILGIYDEWPNNNDWNFYSLSSNDLIFDELDFPIQSLNIMGVKTGDVNNTVFIP